MNAGFIFNLLHLLLSIKYCFKAGNGPQYISESKKLEFRLEVFNFFNHTQFLNPDGFITDGDRFGRVFRSRDPRMMQIALKLHFD